MLGPLSVSLDGCIQFFKAVLASEPWRLDPATVYKPWRQAEFELQDP